MMRLVGKMAKAALKGKGKQVAPGQGKEIHREIIAGSICRTAGN